VGGFTALVTIGGVPNFARIPSYCAQYPDRVCAMLKERNVDTSVPASAWVHDARVKAAVVAALTLAFTFGPQEARGHHSAHSGSGARRPTRSRLIRGLPRPSTTPCRPGPTTSSSPAPVTSPSSPAARKMAKRAPAVCQDVAGFDRQAFHREFNSAVVAFFKAKLPRP